MTSTTTQFCFLNLRSYLIYICCYLLVMVAAGSHVVSGLKCFCNPLECDVIRSLDCPGKGLMLWDPCKCCRICAKTLGETCGGPGEFSGKCEPPLQCVTKLPINSGLGVCTDLSFSSGTSAYHLKNCSNEQTIVIESGCEITNKRCQCWPTLRVCRNEETATTTDSRWHFKTLEDCQLNLQNLIKIEMEFDEDYTISPSTFTFKKIRRKRRAIRSKRRQTGIGGLHNPLGIQITPKRPEQQTRCGVDSHRLQWDTEESPLSQSLINEH